MRELQYGEALQGFAVFLLAPAHSCLGVEQQYLWGMMLLVTEVHPFTDGNGRIGRIMMNAELESQGLGSIIIPNAYREEYLLSLKAVSRQQRFQPYCKMLHRALKLSNNISFSDYQKSLKEIKKRNWFLLPSEGKVIDVE